MNAAVDLILGEAGIEPTPNRVLVLREILAAQAPLSLLELDTRLDSLDKSSISRVLALLSKHDVIHAVEDGRGVAKYERCHGEGHRHSEQDMHVHFYCEDCRATFCLEEVNVPPVSVPDGFRVTSVNYMLKGLCADCARKHS